MSKFVPNINLSHWVIIVPGRAERPHDNPTSPTASRDKCPFCPGQESLNKTLFSLGKVRVITNKYPITDIHEVIIHSPDHDKDIDELPLEDVKMILNTYRARFNYHKKDGRVLIFNNHDVHAGASLAHPHSQLAVVPVEIKLEDIAKEPVSNVVVESSEFVVYCPLFSQWPYEVWIAPNNVIPANAGIYIDSGSRPGMTTFGSITDDQVADLAPLLQKILKTIVNRFRVKPGMTDDIPYNFYIYHGSNWYLRIIPRLVHRAGLELGTGLTVNIVDPATAAAEYKELLSLGAL